MNSETEFITQLVELYREARARMSPEELESEKTRMFNNFAYGTGNNATCQTCRHGEPIDEERAKQEAYPMFLCGRWDGFGDYDGGEVSIYPKDTVGISYRSAAFPLDFGCNLYQPKETEPAKETY